MSIGSRPDSVEKLLDEVEDWEEGQRTTRRKKISVTSMPLIQEGPSPEGKEYCLSYSQLNICYF